MTANQLRQVLRTYTTLCRSWLAVLLWLLIHVMLWGPRIWSSEPLSELLLESMCMPILGSVALGTIMGRMLKLQFANPRARVLPGFKEAHLVVAGAIVGAAIAIQAVLVPPGGGAVEPLALLSLTLSAIVAAAWIAYLMSSIGPFLIIVLLLPAFSYPQYTTGLIQALNDSPIVCLGIACVGLAAMAALGVRLWMLSEEMPEYSGQVPVFWDFTSRAGNRSWRRFEARAVARSHPWLGDLLCRLVLRGNRAMGPLRRLLFRQLAGGFSSLSVMIGVLVVMLIVLWLQSWSQQEIVEPGEVFFYLPFFPVLLVMSNVGGIWLRRWPYLAGESLWPLGRRDFVRDLARSMACDMAPAAGAHCAIIIVWLKLCSPPGPLGEPLPWLALTTAQYVVAYCLMFWLVSFRRFWVVLVGTLAGSSISAALVIAALVADERFRSPVNLALVIIVTALTAALLYRRAFRRWCHVDFD